MPMQPRPIAETSAPPVPKRRFFMTSILLAGLRASGLRADSGTPHEKRRGVRGCGGYRVRRARLGRFWRAACAIGALSRAACATVALLHAVHAVVTLPRAACAFVA